MLSIESIEITDFQSFRGTHTWVLPKRPGLYFLTGFNLLNPSLERNGCGKTTLLDAILWCLYGRTTKGLKASDIINRDAKSCKVAVELTIGDDNFRIESVQNPNSFTINWKSIDRREIANYLHLNYESFVYSIIMPQGAETFFDLSPAAKLTLFSQIMNLDYWLGCADRADAASKLIEAKKLKHERETATLNGKAESISSNMMELKTKASQWESLQTQKCTNLAKELLIRQNETRAIQADIKNLEPAIIRSTKAVEYLHNRVEELAKKVEELDPIREELAKKLAVVDDNIKSVKKIIDYGSECPTCWQVIDDDHLDALSENLTILKKDKIRLVNEHAAVIAERGLRIESYDLVDKDLSIAKSNRLTALGDKDALVREIGFLEREITKLIAEMAQIKQAKNEFEGLWQQKDLELDKVESDLGQLEATIKELNEQYEATHYWVNGFKKLRLYIIEETLKTLEVEVNSNLAALGLPDWRIEFDIERENKSGGITKGFTVLISDPQGRVCKWESFSGGEGQLLRLAGALGLANLICERAGLTSTIEFYDEISSHMSPEVVLNVMELLRQRALSTGRKVIAIDHTAIEYGEFEGVITVTKDQTGSRIQSID